MSKALTTITTTPQGITIKGEPMKAFDTARKHVANILELGRRAAHTSLLLGHELNRLKVEAGAKHGGDRKSSSQTANLIPWDELVEAQTGLSYDTCQRCMKLAEAAKKHIPLLTAEDVLNKPFSALPEQRQKQVIKTLEKAADGRSMSQMMLDFGAWKEKKAKAPPAGGKSAKNDFKGGAHNRGDDLDPAVLRSTALENMTSIRDMRQGGTWQHLDDDELSAQHNQLEGWLHDIALLIKTRKDAEARVKGVKK
jgi:hypothetical protein